MLKNVLLFFALLLLVYLTTVYFWALSSVDDLVPEFESGVRASATGKIVIGKSVTEATGISEQQISFLLLVEDPSFYQHKGISLANGQGLTTITSNVARDIFFFKNELTGIKGAFQSAYRFVFECCKRVDIGRDVMSLALDRKLSKEYQLIYFINNVYMGSVNGNAVYGLDAAADAYFSKPLSVLSNREIIDLVAMVKAPNRFHPMKKPEAHKARADKISLIVSGDCQPDGFLDTDYHHCDKPNQ